MWSGTINFRIMKTLLTFTLTFFFLGIFAQRTETPVQINLKDGGSIDAKHFGQLKCGDGSIMADNYVIIRGKFLGNVTELKDYKNIEKIILEGYDEEPKSSSTGNQKGTLYIQKKNGKTFTLEEAEITLSCYGAGDKYNELVIQIENPITDQVGESTVAVNNISSILFK